MRCGLKPCAKNNDIMVLNSNKVLLTGSDGLLGCKNDIEEETVIMIAKFIDVETLSRDIKESYNFNKIFDLNNSGLTLKNNVVTVKGLKALIEKLIRQ